MHATECRCVWNILRENRQGRARAVRARTLRASSWDFADGFEGSRLLEVSGIRLVETQLLHVLPQQARRRQRRLEHEGLPSRNLRALLSQPHLRP